MTTHHVEQTGTPPEDFVDQVKDALEHMYDFPRLHNHPLVNWYDMQAGSTQTPGQQLRRELVSAIEALNPGADVPFRSPHGRLYNVLHLRYVEGLTVQETAHELGISERQTYRDLRRGEESVADVLWRRQRQTPAAPEEPRAINLSSLQAEMARLETHPRPTDVRELLQQAQKAVDILAQQHNIRFKVDAPEEPVVISTDPVVAHQVLVNLFSQTIKQAQPSRLNLTLMPGPDGPRLVLAYTPKPEAAGPPDTNPVAAYLADRLGWTVNRSQPAGPAREIILRMAAGGPTVLVVDDNEGLVELLSRYLSGHACRVSAAASGQEGLKRVQELLPNAIILDVMMPEMDGWEFLQRLRANPQTASIPVIICSVFNDPELAYSLGASLILPKPVSRQDVLAALRQLGVV